jgi:uncharacterized protein (DUF4415 family)
MAGGLHPDHIGKERNPSGARLLWKQVMKKEYDFRDGKRGAILKLPPGKTRITIRIDDDILQWFRNQVQKAGGGNYQTLINRVLREHIESSRELLTDALRLVVREELARYGRSPK